MKTVLVTMVMALAVGMGVYAQKAAFESVQGTVEFKKPGSSVWEAAVPGRELDRETLVSTGFRSEARIKVGNSVLLVRPLTRLSLGEIEAAAAGERVDIRLRSGRLHVDVKPPAGGNVDFTVRGPSVTASVRGTAFEFDTVNLRVDEGTVYFSGADNTAVYVGAGQSSAPDPVSGKTAAPVETAAVQAAPPPVGAEELAAPPAVIPGPVPQAPVNLGMGWADNTPPLN
jgi:hypothetical protein